MNQITLSLGAAALLALSLTACGSSEDTPAGAKKLSFELTDEGCLPLSAKAPAGPITFEAENTGTTKVTEIEVMEGDTILGEKENLSDGLSGSFSLTLDAGEYTIYCPGGEDERGTLTVTGELKAKGSAKADAAVAGYREYLEENANDLVRQTKPFVAAVVAGNVTEAKALYPVDRIFYERIEPVAESFGSLDPRIDARENDVAADEFEGFHRIEKALWQEGTAKGMAPVAKQLQADVEELAERVETVELRAVQVANGAVELLGEVSASKITGEEERYSHTDLVDFEANVEGAEAAFEAVKPLLDETDPELSGELEADFKMVFAELQPYRKGSGFLPYTELTKADTRKLARAIDTLAEKLSQVPAAIAQAEHA
ncbi:MAG TPA: iron uptake system protein EfeO [Solirubrobacterales bacterium]|jgi:iron uptake system component EfeO|nr:iron uptake system protein EfeO [Solirubrobacterales bacterium]